MEQRAHGETRGRRGGERGNQSRTLKPETSRPRQVEAGKGRVITWKCTGKDGGLEKTTRWGGREAGSRLTMGRGDGGRQKGSHLEGMRRSDELEERKGTDWHGDDSQMRGRTGGSV